MIDIVALNSSDVGKPVIYTANHNGEKEFGRIKSWNDKVVFVVYKCGGNWHRFKEYTACATPPENLEFEE